MHGILKIMECKMTKSLVSFVKAVIAENIVSHITNLQFFV